MTLRHGVCNFDTCALVPYQGQGQRSTSRSLHSKIVKTFLILTKCFRFLNYLPRFAVNDTADPIS